jgi:hypothetical protein
MARIAAFFDVAFIDMAFASNFDLAFTAAAVAQW